MTFVNSVAKDLSVDASVGELGKAKRKLKKKAPVVPAFSNPREGLKSLVKRHRALTRAAVAIGNMATDKKNRATGEPILCLLPVDSQAELHAVAKLQRKKAAGLEVEMLGYLRKLPIYELFLKRVYGVGAVVAAYLASEVDIRKSVKPSQLRRFCGYAVVNGHLERPVSGEANHYSKEMRTRIHQAFGSMWKNAAKKSSDAPHGNTCKYLDIWTDYKNRIVQSDRYDPKENTLTSVDGTSKRKGAKALMHGAGRHHAIDVFLQDLYTIWRASEALEVWPSYVEGKVNHRVHKTGEVCDGLPVMMTTDEAMALVGHVGKTPRREPLLPMVQEEPEEDNDEMEEEL